MSSVSFLQKSVFSHNRDLFVDRPLEKEIIVT